MLSFPFYAALKTACRRCACFPQGTFSTLSHLKKCPPAKTQSQFFSLKNFFFRWRWGFASWNQWLWAYEWGQEDSWFFSFFLQLTEDLNLLFGCWDFFEMPLKVSASQGLTFSIEYSLLAFSMPNYLRIAHSWIVEGFPLLSFSYHKVNTALFAAFPFWDKLSCSRWAEKIIESFFRNQVNWSQIVTF